MNRSSIRRKRLILFAAAGSLLLGCGDMMLSRVTDNVLAPVSTRARSELTYEEVILATDVMAPATIDRLFAGKAGLVCFRAKTSLATVRDCVTGASALTASKEGKAITHLFLPARKGDQVELEIVAIIKPSDSTLAGTKGLANVLEAAEAMPGAGDFVKIARKAVELAGEPVDKTVGSSFVFSLGVSCPSPTCNGVLEGDDTFVVTFGLKPGARSRTLVVGNGVVERNGDALPIPALVIHTRVVAFDDEMLSLACRRDLATSEPKDDKKVGSCLDAEQALPRQVAAWQELVKFEEKARAKSLDAEGTAGVLEETERWATENCGDGRAFPLNAAPCAFARRLSGQLVKLEPEARQIFLATRAATEAEKRATTLTRNTSQDFCSAMDQARALQVTAEEAAVRLSDCGEDGCVRLDHLSELRKTTQVKLSELVVGCYAEKIKAQGAAATPGARALITKKNIEEGTVTMIYDPSSPPTEAVLAETVKIMDKASTGLAPSTSLKVFQGSWVSEAERLSAAHALLSSGTDSLRRFVGAVLRAPMDRVRELGDPYFDGRLREADEVISSIDVQRMFVKTPAGLMLSERARDLLTRALSLYGEFTHTLELRATVVVEPQR